MKTLFFVSLFLIVWLLGCGSDSATYPVCAAQTDLYTVGAGETRTPDELSGLWGLADIDSDGLYDSRLAISEDTVVRALQCTFNDGESLFVFAQARIEITTDSILVLENSRMEKTSGNRYCRVELTLGDSLFDLQATQLQVSLGRARGGIKSSGKEGPGSIGQNPGNARWAKLSDKTLKCE